MEQQTCPHCGTTDTPTAKLRDGERYLFCERCKKTITNDEFLDIIVDDFEFEADVNINIYNDQNEKYVIISVKDWEKILKLFKEGGAELHIS
jgi:hypothetical protein